MPLSSNKILKNIFNNSHFKMKPYLIKTCKTPTERTHSRPSAILPRVLSWQALLLSRLWISVKTSFFTSKINENCRSLPPMKCLIFFILEWYSYLLITLKAGSVMSELAILLARVLSISNFSTSLLKCLLKISASSSLLLIVWLLLFKIIDSLWKAFSEKRELKVFQNFLLSETTP